MLKTEKFPRESVIIQSALLAMYGIVCLLAIFHHLYQRDFYSWDLYKNLYGIVAVGAAVHAVGLFFADKFLQKKELWMFTLAADIILVSALLLRTELNVSIFLFLYLLIIIVSGLFFQYRGALLAALACSVGLTLATLLGPDMKSVSYFFFLIINNILFFLTAGLSAYLSEQLEIQGITLGALRRLNQTMVDSLPVGLLMTDGAGSILRGNPQAQQIFSQDSLDRKNIFTLFPQAKDLLTTAIRGRAHLVKELPFAQGEQNLILRTQVIPQTEGTEQRHLVVVEDLTKIRQMELAMRQSEKLAAVGQLAAGIAHEIRNPLTGISGSIEMLSQKTQTEEDQKLMKIIMREIDRLNALVSEFLDYSKPEKVPTDPVDISELVQDLVRTSVVGGLMINNLKIDTDIEEHLKIRGHADKLRQAFLNIIINAIQAMDETNQPRLGVRVRKVNNIVDVSVSDNGVGMSAQIKDRMFEPFMTTKAKGTGLGLAMTHKIMDMHQALIFVDSEPGRGTEIHVHFPLLEN